MEALLRKIVTVIIIVMVALVSVGILVSAYQTVPTGYQGVVLQWGNPVRSVGAGLNLITPIAEDIALVDIQVQKVTAQESAASSDLQEVSTSVTVNYQLDANYAREIYTNLRDQYESRVILPAMQDALKAATAKFQASELITQREAAKNLFLNLLQEKLTQYHINVVSVSITDFQFSESFKMAIEAKVTAEQNALAAKNKLEQIGYEAQQQVIQANANATAIITIAQANANATIISANATAQAVEIIQAQLTPEYIQYLYAIGWDGKLPIYWSSGNSTAPFLLLPVDQSTNSTGP
ncbi:MAG: prohibitin family protein [Candidatus Bathyarchaeia archaeon]|jgi:regulator of protease activity HflC (stomatin/prohibitin superfamily)